MNREIKFRGISVDTGEWVYGSMVRGVGELVDRVYIVPAIITGYYSVYSMMDCIEVDPSTVGQYIGIKDKNGVDIYEGDVLNLNNYCIGNNNTPEGKLVFVVKWEDQIGCGCCGYGTGYDFEAHNNIEVIGNIHQNPELLNS